MWLRGRYERFKMLDLFVYEGLLCIQETELVENATRTPLGITCPVSQLRVSEEAKALIKGAKRCPDSLAPIMVFESNEGPYAAFMGPHIDGRFYGIYTPEFDDLDTLNSVEICRQTNTDLLDTCAIHNATPSDTILQAVQG